MALLLGQKHSMPLMGHVYVFTCNRLVCHQHKGIGSCTHFITGLTVIQSERGNAEKAAAKLREVKALETSRKPPCVTGSNKRDKNREIERNTTTQKDNTNKPAMLCYTQGQDKQRMFLVLILVRLL